MKRFITSVTLLVCTLLVSGSFVRLVAQPNAAGGLFPPLTACEPDCPETPFENAYNITGQQFFETEFEICQGCTVSVQWTKRIACKKYYDVFIDRITSRHSNDPACMACFTTYSTADLLTMASIQLLELNPMQFPPSKGSKEGDCVANYRVVKGPCWGKHYYNNSSSSAPDYMHRAQACPTKSTCCLDYFEVCLIDGKRVATPRAAKPGEVAVSPSSIVCNGVSLTPGTVDVITSEAPYDCKPVCGPVPPSDK